MGSFWFKRRRSKYGIEYLADKIPFDADRIEYNLDGKPYYIVTWEYDGKQYQDEVLASDVMEYVEDGAWVKIKEEANEKS